MTVNATIRFKGYRGFSTTEFGLLHVRPGVSAVVGTNNSGKSTLIRALYELRHLFAELQNTMGLQQLVGGAVRSISYPGVADPIEIFHGNADEAIRIEIEFANYWANGVRRIDLLCDPRRPSDWHGEAYAADQSDPVGSVSGLDLVQAEQLGRAALYSRYFGPYRNVLPESAGMHYESPIGRDFVAHWAELQTGENRGNNRFATRILDQTRELFGFRSLVIQASKDGETLQVVINDRPQRLRELGAGFVQCFQLLVSTAHVRPSFLCIDEPEVHLHPALAIRLLDALRDHVDDGIIFASHSVGLARAIAGDILIAHPPGITPRVVPFDDPRTSSEMMGELTLSAFRELGADTVLFVEGKHDVPVIRNWIQRAELGTRIVVLPLRGASAFHAGAPKDLAETLRVADHVAVLIDSERDSADAEVEHLRQQFADDCRNYGIRVHITERRALENYFTQEAIDAAGVRSTTALTPFEKPSKPGRGWDKAVNWKIASAMSCSDVESTDVGKFLRSL